MNLNVDELLTGTMLLVDKPLGWTSFDVVNKIRYAIRSVTREKKIKVGHAGTLDPMATGLLVICTGSWTKKLDFFQSENKTYTGTMELGATTPSFDTESSVDQIYPIDHLTESKLYDQANSMTGELEQFPPIYSAIKQGGQPLYKLARSGRNDIEVPLRVIQIYHFELQEIQLPSVSFEVQCSKGTYIRSLVHDFGKGLQSGAYLTSLRRTGSGNYQVSDAWELSSLVDHINQWAT